MVVRQVNVVSIRTSELERNSPVFGDSYRPRSPSSSLEFVEIQARQIHVLWTGGSTQATKDDANSISLLSLNSTRSSASEEDLQPPMLETLYHNP